RRRDDVVSVLLPNLFVSLSAYVFFDFLEDVAHGAASYVSPSCAVMPSHGGRIFPILRMGVQGKSLIATMISASGPRWQSLSGLGPLAHGIDILLAGETPAAHIGGIGGHRRLDIRPQMGILAHKSGCVRVQPKHVFHHPGCTVAFGR